MYRTCLVQPCKLRPLKLQPSLKLESAEEYRECFEQKIRNHASRFWGDQVSKQIEL